MPNVSMEALLARSSQRRHTDPGRKVQLVFHGSQGGSRRPSLINLVLPLPPLMQPKKQVEPVRLAPPSQKKPADKLDQADKADKAEKPDTPRASRDTTMTPNAASLASTGDEGTPKHVRFRTTITECEVTTPYGVIYDGIRPMDFDFDRWGRKIYHFFPAPEDEEDDD
mmetsp:Transcript_52499/g.122507  ORF Transcript_52499/g.122507 Transcript_52499/m.122507 type:complete len:168 (+) Transcript_52499:3-506(+)